MEKSGHIRYTAPLGYVVLRYVVLRYVTLCYVTLCYVTLFASLSLCTLNVDPICPDYLTLVLFLPLFYSQFIISRMFA